eukprot:8107274-Pyramimonas_sp.AAC.1
MTNDVASLEDVYRAASRGRGDGDARVMAAVRDRLAEAQNAISSSIYPSSTPRSRPLCERGPGGDRTSAPPGRT